MNDELNQGNNQNQPPEPQWPATPPAPPEGWQSQLPTAPSEAEWPSAPPASPAGYDPNQPPQASPYPPQGGYYPPGQPPRKRRGAFIALLVVAALLVTTAVGAYAFKDLILLKTNPEAYLTNSITKANDAIDASQSLLPDFTKFKGRPILQELTVRLDEIPGMPVMLAGDSEFKMSLKSDLATRRALLEFSMQMSMITLTGNKIYISEDMIGVELPSILPGYNMVTIDPKTFVQEWNKSDYAMYTSTIPSNIDLPEIVDAFFAYFESAENAGVNEEYLKYQDKMTSIWETFKGASAVSYEGKVSLNTSGEAKEYYHLVRIFPKESAEDMMMDIFDLVVDIYDEALTSSMYPGSEYIYEDFMTSMEEARDMLSEVEITEDVACHFHVDKSGRLSRIRIPALSFSVPDYWDEDEDEYTISLDLTMNGDKNPLDDLRAEIIATNHEYDDEVSAIITRNASLEGGVANSRWKLVGETEYGGGELVLDYHWDQNAVSGENFKVSLTYEDEYEDVEMALTGTLVETESSVSMTDGVLEVTMYDETLSLRMDYIHKEINPSELDAEQFSTISLFDITPEALIEAAQNSVLAFL